MIQIRNEFESPEAGACRYAAASQAAKAHIYVPGTVTAALDRGRKCLRFSRRQLIHRGQQPLRQGIGFMRVIQVLEVVLRFLAPLGWLVQKPGVAAKVFSLNLTATRRHRQPDLDTVDRGKRVAAPMQVRLD